MSAFDAEEGRDLAGGAGLSHVVGAAAQDKLRLVAGDGGFQRVDLAVDIGGAAGLRLGEGPHAEELRSLVALAHARQIDVAKEAAHWPGRIMATVKS